MHIGGRRIPGRGLMCCCRNVRGVSYNHLKGQCSLAKVNKKKSEQEEDIMICGKEFWFYSD